MTRPTPGPNAGARLQRYLQVIECRYPHAWEQIDGIRRLYLPAGLWPAWCHVPLGRIRDLICPEDMAHDPTRLVDVAIVAGLAAWRSSQRIIIASDRAAEALAAPLDLDRSPDLLHTLLDRPVYIELPPGTLGSPTTGPTRGALLHLTQDERTRQTELRLLIEPTRRWTLGSIPLVPLAMPLVGATLARCLDTLVREQARRHDRLVRHAVAGELAVALHSLMRLCTGVIVPLLEPASSTGASEAGPEIEEPADPVVLTPSPPNTSPSARRFA
jgi:hypothetical protein